MRDSRTTEPFSLLGGQLRQLRSQARETLAEASSAVEISIGQLISLEMGKSRPSEELLLLLLNHFKPKDTDALKLWKLAGYGGDAEFAEFMPILYAQGIEVNASKSGLTIDFVQSDSPEAESRNVSRIGMSREQAEGLIKTLILALTATHPRNQKLLLPKDDSETT